MESEFITGFDPIKPEGDYYDLKDFISYSGLKNLKTSPAHYKQYKDVLKPVAVLPVFTTKETTPDI